MHRRLVIALLVLAATVGAAAGIGAYTFIYAQGWSYMTDDPAACMNCHVMRDQYRGWTRSSHHAVATCNDCHTPKDFLGKYLTKASNGYHHSLAFTTGNFHEPIRIKGHNRDIAEKSCRRCHGDIVAAIDAHHDAQKKVSCISCHGSVGHP